MATKTKKSSKVKWTAPGGSGSVGSGSVGSGSVASGSVASDASGNCPSDCGRPVECNVCQRRFKNTPALNGHMRLHGGFLKKDSECKKPDKKDPNTPPLQTASVSIRALIEEKIIQRRNMAAAGVGSVGSGGVGASGAVGASSPEEVQVSPAHQSVNNGNVELN